MARVRFVGLVANCPPNTAMQRAAVSAAVDRRALDRTGHDFPHRHSIETPGGKGSSTARAGARITSISTWGQHPLVLSIGKCWNGILPVSEWRLIDEECARIVPRLVAYMGYKGDPVEIRDE